jgi:hypothetical protein
MNLWRHPSFRERVACRGQCAIRFDYAGTGHSAGIEFGSARFDSAVGDIGAAFAPAAAIKNS